MIQSKHIKQEGRGCMRERGRGYRACEGEVQRILETERQIVLVGGTVQIENIIDILLGQ